MRNIPNTGIARAADDETGAGPVTEEARTKIADRNWVGADGNPVDSEEEATGVSYKFLGRTKGGVTVPADPDGFVIQFADMSEQAKNMLAGFGALTLMGNVTNTWLGEKGDKQDTARDAIAERFALLNQGQWVDRTREGVGARIDLDVLAEAIMQWAESKGATKDKAEVRAKLENKELARQFHKNPEVASFYAQLKGRPVATADELLGSI